MPPARPRQSRLIKLLRSADFPIYAVDGQGGLVFVNPPCAAWLASEPSALVGQTCIYGAGNDATREAELAAVLAPPPAAFTGQICQATLYPPEAPRANTIVATDTEGTSPFEPSKDTPLSSPPAPCATTSVVPPVASGILPLSPAVFRFLPLATEQGAVSLVIGYYQHAGIEDNSPEPVDPMPAELHAQLQKLRRRRSRAGQRQRFVGVSAQICRVREQIAMAAGCRVHITIVGPLGSGRQHVAAAIHARSDLAEMPLVALPCADLSGELFEEDVSRYLRDSETSPRTLLLHDIDHLSLESQQQLHRLLVEQAHGCRMIATARQSLRPGVGQGNFHPELALLLTTAVIELPPLESRLPDLPLLAQSLLEEVNGESAKQIGGFKDEALRQLLLHSWPHDVDELMEAVRHAHNHCTGPLIDVTDLPESIRLANEAARRPRRPNDTIHLEKFLLDVELECIQRALTKAKGNKALAARLLGMTRPRLYRRLEQLGLNQDDSPTKP